MEEMIVAQHSDTFCTDIARRLNEGVVLPFSQDENGLLVRSAFQGPQIVVPQWLKNVCCSSTTIRHSLDTPVDAICTTEYDAISIGSRWK